MKQVNKMGRWSVLFHHFGNVLETRVSGIRIEALSALIAVVMSFLVIFGSWRRWSTNWFIQKGVMAAYFLSFVLVTYTIGLMQSAAVKVEVYPIWAVCFLTVFGCTNSISAYSMDDNYHSERQLFQYFLYTAYVLLILFSVADGVSFIAVFLMLVITLVKLYVRIVSAIAATITYLGAKIYADYMMSAENEREGSYYDPISMDGYLHLVEIIHQDIRLPSAPNYAMDFPVYPITIYKLWQECDDDDGPLGSSVRACKDISLSFSLFLLLVVRFFGYTGCESKQPKTKDFVIKGLLDNMTDHNHERAFEVIEAELAFLYDFFFTKYNTFNRGGTMIWALASLASILFVMALTVVRAAGIFPNGGENASSTSHASVAKATVADNIITVIILAALALLEVLQIVFYWTSNWGRVEFAKQFMQLHRPHRYFPSFSMRLKAFLCRMKLFSSRKYYWKHHLGQYSLLHSIGSNTCVRSLLGYVLANCSKILSHIGLPHPIYVVQEVSYRAGRRIHHPTMGLAVSRRHPQPGGPSPRCCGLSLINPPAAAHCSGSTISGGLPSCCVSFLVCFIPRINVIKQFMLRTAYCC